MQSAIELPTRKHSFRNPRPDDTVDIHDPQWIPVLDPVQTPRQHDEKEPLSYGTSPFALKAAQRSSQSHTYTRSSLAPESVALARETQATPSREDVPEVPDLPPLPPSPTTFELPAARPKSEYFQHKSIIIPKGEAKDESTDTEGTTESSADRSTIGTASLLEEQVYSLPGQALSAKDARDDVAILPPLPLSTRSSFTSLRKTGPIVPTSKYSRKPVPGRSITPLASPRLSSVSPVQRDQLPRVSSISSLQQEQTQRVQDLPSANIHSPKQSTIITKSPLSTSLRVSKSSASQKRQAALHSHPSTNSLSSRRKSSASGTEVPVVSATPAPQSRSRPTSDKSADSRINDKSSFTSVAPTPAPTTPLPQLPHHASSLSYEPDAMPQAPPEAQVEGRPKLRNDHSQMASFMTNTQTMVFRRFDDVHVQLLLCLQDEISDLERKLSELDNVSMTRNDRTMERMRVIRDLRRVVGEYDQLFASWSSMKAAEVPKSTRADLRQWLERPQSTTGATRGKGAREDLLRLDGAKDLSSINLGTCPPEKGQEVNVDPVTRKKPGFFATCLGKRK